MSKFQLKCCCVVCKTETTTQSLKTHLKTHEPKRFCKHCNAPMFTNETQFCSRSCAAKYNNVRKDYTKFRPGPKPLSKPPKSVSRTRESRTKELIEYTPVTQCIICNKYFSSKGKYHTLKAKTCSTACKSTLLSNKMQERIQAGFNPNDNRGRGKRSYLEESFEHWLQTNYPDITYVAEQPFKRRDVSKTYFVDFYFPDLQFAIELDGSQHLDSVAYDTERDSYIERFYGVEILRISHKEYTTKKKLLKIKELLERAKGFEPSPSAS